MTGRTFNASTATELLRVAKLAVGGDTILLSPGSYGDVHIRNLNPGANVTIKSANPKADAVFRTLQFSKVSNFTIEDVDVSNPLAPGQPDFTAAIRVTSARDITFVGVDVAGSRNGNSHDDGSGIVAQNSSRIAVLDSTFTDLNRAAVFARVDDVVFAGNTIREVREGLNIAEIDGALVERNYFTRVMPNLARGDHADAIQVHAGGAFGSSQDLTIRSNVLKLGDSTAQGIFIRNEKARTGAMHKDITIEDNYFEGNSRHGITLNDTIGAEISGNTIRDMGTMGLAPGLNVANVRDGVIEDNIAPLLLTSPTLPNTNVVWRDNIDVWDRVQRSGVSDASLFSTKVGSGDMDFSSLNVRVSSIAAVQGIGFAAVDGIGDLKASAAAVMAAYLPQFDAHLPHVAML
jgi:parallel beta-helix repeat protein